MKGGGYSISQENQNLLRKFATIILLVLMFVLLMYVGTSIIIYFNSPKKNPYVTTGLINGNKPLEIQQNPNEKDSVTILRSVDQDNGIELTWSIWLYVNSPPDNDSEFSTTQYKHIFHKGNLTKTNSNNIYVPNNAPGFYFKYNNAKFSDNGDKNLSLHIFMNTYETILEEIIINEIPIEKWFHVAFRIKQKTADIFVNGQIVKRKIFSSIPKQNYDNVYIAQNGGFNGKISEIRYFSNALSGNEILTIVNNGPDLRNKDRKKAMDYYPPYFSINWFFKR